MRLKGKKGYAGVFSGELVAGADPERVEAEREHKLAEARRIAVEAPFSDFDLRETAPDKWLFVDRATGQHYRRVGHLVDPSTAHMDNIACFTIDAAGSIHFLRRRGEGGVPTSVVRHGTVRGMEVKPGTLPPGDDWRIA